MPTFQPKSREELVRLLTDGPYQATITNAIEKTSKASGAPMIELHLELYGDDGAKFVLGDYLVFSDKALFKVLQFCEAAGLTEQYNAGNLSAHDCIDKVVWVKVGTQRQEGYDPKNTIKSYFVPKADKPSESKRRPPNNQPLGKDDNGDPDCPF